MGDQLWEVFCVGAGGRTRTDMSLTSPDFESGAYTNFATPASRGNDNKSSYYRIATEVIRRRELIEYGNG
jgi:hypothetical protein